MVIGIISMCWYFFLVYGYDINYRESYDIVKSAASNFIWTETRCQISLNFLMECLYEKIGLPFTAPIFCEYLFGTLLNAYENFHSIEIMETEKIFNKHYALTKYREISTGNLCENQFGIEIGRASCRERVSSPG